VRSCHCGGGGAPRGPVRRGRAAAGSAVGRSFGPRRFCWRPQRGYVEAGGFAPSSACSLPRAGHRGIR